MLNAPLTAFIPPPPFNQIGPLHLYGLCIALGVVAAVTISSRRWEARGGDPEDIATIAIWAVPAGVIGARIYHVATDWKRYQDNWIDALKITQGGLGIPGGIFFGVLVGLLVARKKGLRLPPLFDVVAPAIPVAQAIGRLGNYFNQEVFGRPTEVAWALKVDPEFRPPEYATSATFHPTFLYEALWNLALAALLVRLDRKRIIRPGQLFTLYVLGYAIGRLWVEMLRSDEASLIFGIRINVWMSVVVGLIALAVFIRAWRLGPGDPGDHMATAEAAAALALESGTAGAAGSGGSARSSKADRVADGDDPLDGVDGVDGDGGDRADAASDDDAEPPSAAADQPTDPLADDDEVAADLEEALEDDALFVEDEPDDPTA